MVGEFGGRIGLPPVGKRGPVQFDSIGSICAETVVLSIVAVVSVVSVVAVVAVVPVHQRA